MTILIFLSAGDLLAQVGVKVTPTGRHAEMIRKVKNRTGEWDKERWQAYKDSLKQVKKTNKQAKKELDSLFKTSKDQKKLDELFGKHAGDSSKVGKLREKALKKGIDPANLPSVKNDSSLYAEVKRVGDQNFGQFEEYQQAQEYI